MLDIRRSICESAARFHVRGLSCGVVLDFLKLGACLECEVSTSSERQRGEGGLWGQGSEAKKDFDAYDA
jgi:hypothetical protein